MHFGNRNSNTEPEKICSHVPYGIACPRSVGITGNGVLLLDCAHRRYKQIRKKQHTRQPINNVANPSTSSITKSGVGSKDWALKRGQGVVPAPSSFQGVRNNLSPHPRVLSQHLKEIETESPRLIQSKATETIACISRTWENWVVCLVRMQSGLPPLQR